MRKGADYLGLYLMENPKIKALSTHHLTLPLPNLDDTILPQIMMFRDPLERVTSVYNFEKKQIDAVTPGAIHARKFNLKEYVEWRMKPDVGETIRNFYANRCLPPRKQRKEPFSENEILDAKKFISSIEMLGLVEQFDESMVVFEEFLKECNPYIDLSYVLQNVGQHIDESRDERIKKLRDAVGEETFKVLKEKNKEDIDLYNYVKKEFKLRVSKISNFNEKLQSFRKRCKEQHPKSSGVLDKINILTENKFIQKVKGKLWTSVEERRRMQQQGVNIIPANFYSNIPSIDDVENSFEYANTKSDGVYNASGIFNHEKMTEFIEEFSIYSSEFSPPIEAGGDSRKNQFFWKNPAFSYSDAMAYYCMIRHFKPDRIMEIGSGYSTLVADEALSRNGKGKLMLIEPFPKEFLHEIKSVENIIQKFVQEIDLAEMISLVESCDMWFIDSTHTVKIGSDCLYIYLKIMPEIKKDIVVHVHDIFLPFPPPKTWPLDHHIYWTEQYLLYAYMLDNPKIEMLFGSAYAHNCLPEATEKLMKGKYPSGGGSVWFKLMGEKCGH